MTVKQLWFGLMLSFLICFAASGIGAFSTTSQIDGWYATLNRPSYAPPNWIFGPLWTILYAMMAVAAWLVWKQEGFWKAAAPLGIFAVQLILNVIWSVLFFGLQNPGIALIEIILLWMAIFATIILFARRSMPAGILLVPYLLWVSFASVLNYGFWSLNP
ncbi:tryptophan-rich sensory protein [Planctomycetaceae bacterium]|jgi:translocator protein|nr:tryptophan-rich sensory protein [bacterium]MDC0261889.1 tryptophan-rich sensory protein [Planctomycetaceae bacterium]MDG2388723.1 tryptophan-rich sensory protein [Planctomycetaceae bacterium]